MSKKDCISLVREIESLLFRLSYDMETREEALEKAKELVNMLEHDSYRI